jgi:hypothetical protein
MEWTGRPAPRWLAAVVAFAVVGALAGMMWSERSGSTRPAPQAPGSPPVAGTPQVPSTQAPETPASSRTVSADPGASGVAVREYRVRIHNATGLDLEGVRLVPRTGRAMEFGALPAGTSTEYRTVEFADDQATIMATAGRSYGFRQDRYRGEAEWIPADYTYALGLDARGRPVFTFSGWA